MKKLILSLGFLAMTLASQAQTNFFTTAFTWATSFNTNYTWTNATLELYTGTVNYNNQNMEAIFGIRVDPWKGLDTGLEIQNVSALGTVSQLSGVLGYSLSHYDFRMSGEVSGGWRPIDNVAVFTPRLVIEKLMTQNTATKLVLGIPVNTKGKQNFTPNVSVEATVLAW